MTKKQHRSVSGLPGEPQERLGDVLCGAEPGTPVAFESAYGWGWLAELLDDMGLEPHLAHAKGCKAIAHARLKNDRVDARILAHLLRSDLLPEAWIAPRPVKELRMILRHRAALVRQRTVFKSRVRAVLADRGIDAPEALWDGPGRRWLAQVELPAVEREVVEDLCGLLDAMEIPIRRLEKQIRQLAKPDPRVEALQHLRGIGLLTAMTLVAEVGDISRFPDARKLCAWSGLTPKVRNSDQSVHHGRMTKQGPAAVRAVLVEAAQTAKVRAPFAEVYDSIRRRRGRQIATVAVARRLLAQSFHVLEEVNNKIATGEADRCAG